MKTRTILLALVFCLVAGLAGFADDDSTMGTWKLNEAKSKIPAGAPKNDTVVYAMDGDNIKCVIDGTDGSGQPLHSEWTGQFDGKEYPVTGDPTSDGRKYTKKDDRHYEFTTMKDGKMTGSGTIVYAEDGNSRTVTSQAKDANGKTITTVAVYDKQQEE